MADGRVRAPRFTYYLTLNRLLQGDAVLWAALVQGTSGRSGGVLFYVYGSPDAPANLQVSQGDSSFTLRQHLLTPEQVAAVRTPVVGPIVSLSQPGSSFALRQVPANSKTLRFGVPPSLVERAVELVHPARHQRCAAVCFSVACVVLSTHETIAVADTTLAAPHTQM